MNIKQLEKEIIKVVKNIAIPDYETNEWKAYVKQLFNRYKKNESNRIR
jgi:hypothetical protein